MSSSGMIMLVLPDKEIVSSVVLMDMARAENGSLTYYSLLNTRNKEDYLTLLTRMNNDFYQIPTLHGPLWYSTKTYKSKYSYWDLLNFSEDYHKKYSAVNYIYLKNLSNEPLLIRCNDPHDHCKCKRGIVSVNGIIVLFFGMYSTEFEQDLKLREL